MSKNIRTLYLYIISFITLGMMVIGFVSFVNGIASYAFPTVSGYYSYDDDEYFKYNDEYIQDKKDDKRESLRNTISSFAVIAIGTPLFVYHWKKASSLDTNKEV